MINLIKASDAEIDEKSRDHHRKDRDRDCDRERDRSAWRNRSGDRE